MSVKSLKQFSLLLFFTEGLSLSTWDHKGIFEREVALYRYLQNRGFQVIFITYGGQNEITYEKRLNGIRILCNRWGLPRSWYIWLLIHFYPLLWRGPLIFKSNQVKGAKVALLAAQRSGKPFIARCGYLLSFNMAQKYGYSSPQAQSARALEAYLFTRADRVVVTTPNMRQMVIENYKLSMDKVKVIPNYVDTNLFKPNPNNSRVPRRICYIGRLVVEKNLFALLEAVKGLDVELLIIGDGNLKDKLITKAQNENIPVRFLGNQPNTVLPQYLNSSEIFILPSLYEGHPKALLEAMACGLPVIGTNVPGIRELIQHCETGYLCGTSPEEIRIAIQDVLNDRELRTRMGRNAREFVVENFSLEQIVEMEIDLLNSLIQEKYR